MELDQFRPPNSSDDLPSDSSSMRSIESLVFCDFVSNINEPALHFLQNTILTIVTYNCIVYILYILAFHGNYFYLVDVVVPALFHICLFILYTIF